MKYIYNKHYIRLYTQIYVSGKKLAKNVKITKTNYYNKFSKVICKLKYK